MKVSKERRQLCSDVTNSHKAEARKRSQQAFDRQMDTIFGYALLTAMVITFIITFVDWWRSV